MLENNDKNNEPIDCLPVLIDLIPDPVLVIDNAGKIIFANKLIGKTTGHKKEQLIGKNFCTLGSVSEEYKLLQAKNATNKSEGSNIPPYEIRVTTKSGEVKCLKANGNRFINKGETLDLAVFHDFTEENKIQNELQQGLLENEEKFQSITNSVKEAIITVDQEAIVTYWNSAAENIFGYTAKEAIGKSVHELVVPNSMCNEGKDRIETSVKTFSETGIGYFTVGNVELVGRRKNNSEFPAELSISPVKLNGKLSAVGVVKDITKRKQDEQKLREAEQRYRALFNQAPLGVLVVDPETAAFVEFNDVAHMQLGYLRKEFEEIKIFDIEAKESPDEVRFHLQEMVLEGGGEFETEHRTKNGDIKNILVTTRAFQSAGKTFLHCIFHDITERKRLQTKLAEYSQKLEELVQQRTEQLKKTQAELVKSERLAAIGELAGMVGHDLRNPLTGIKNSAYFMKKKGNEISQTQAQEMLETINKCVDYSNKIVNDLIDYSREVRLELREETLKKLLTESLGLLDIPEKIEILNHLDDKPTVKIDADKIKRVFINLIKNAIDAMPKGGKITIDSNQVNGSLEVSFSDTGVGIADDVLPKLFSPLFTTKAQGMGFGLAICKRIIEAHGGTITVKTVKGKGTTFTVTLLIEPKLEIGGENTWINIPESSLLTTMKQ